jgi:TPR repeat protein
LKKKFCEYGAQGFYFKMIKIDKKRFVQKLLENYVNAKIDVNEVVLNLKHIKIAAQEKLPIAESAMGHLYDNGIGFGKNGTKAFFWYRLAAKHDYAHAQTWLGYAYDNGIYGARSQRKALFWYGRAARQGDACAQFHLGVLYTEVKKPDYKKSFEFLKKSAAQGFDLAQCNLGVAFENGIGTKADISQAVKWYRKAAHQGDPVASYNLGLCFAKGLGVRKNSATAISCFNKSALAGYKKASKALKKELAREKHELRRNRDVASVGSTPIQVKYKLFNNASPSTGRRGKGQGAEVQ